jgi:hypothetical protein
VGHEKPPEGIIESGRPSQRRRTSEAENWRRISSA